MTSPLAQPDGRVAVITGAASGFGRELATQCAALGMRLVLADLDLAGLNATRALTGLDDKRALPWRCDVADAASVDALATAASLHFGTVHLLFNNAGVIAAGPPWKATPQDWAWVFGVNVMGVAHGIRAFVPDMIARGEPAWVVNTASLAGLVCPPELGVYSASKHAVVAASECLFHELRAAGHPVGVSVLCPAYVDTRIADSQRHRPADLAEANPDNDDFMAGTRTAMKSGRLIRQPPCFALRCMSLSGGRAVSWRPMSRASRSRQCGRSASTSSHIRVRSTAWSGACATSCRVIFRPIRWVPRHE